jgi:Mrp family chromosome partitioning ATPase
MKDARSRFDFVLLDSAPVVPVSESALIARRADAAILVIREGATDRGEAQLAKKRLAAMDVKILGAVLNCASPMNAGYGYYYEKHRAPQS